MTRTIEHPNTTATGRLGARGLERPMANPHVGVYRCTATWSGTKQLHATTFLRPRERSRRT